MAFQPARANVETNLNPCRIGGRVGIILKDRKQSIIMKVGQTVYLRPNQFADARTKKQGIQTDTIQKVGRKYVYLSGTRKYDIATGLECGDHYSYFKMYPDKKSLDLQLEREALEKKVRSSIATDSEWDIDIDKLRKIVAIIES